MRTASRRSGFATGSNSSAIRSSPAAPRSRAPSQATAPSEKIDDRARQVQALQARLTAGVSANRDERNEDEQARWLLAHLLDWHRRESNVTWREFYRLRDLTEDGLLDEKAAIAGLRFVERIGGTSKCPVDCYAYPQQDTDVGVGAELYLSDGESFGNVEAIDRGHRTVDVKKRGAQAECPSTRRVRAHVGEYRCPHE